LKVLENSRKLSIRILFFAPLLNFSRKGAVGFLKRRPVSLEPGRFNMADSYNNNLSDPKDVELEAAISRAVRSMGIGIHVSARSGHVTLSGVVDDFETKRSISSVVHGVGGVHEIVNNIRVARVAD
jgi:hypothetical protein